MKHRRVALTVSFAVAVVIGLGTQAIGQAPAPAAQGQGQMPRLAGRPNLNGIWQSINTAHWDLEAHEAQPSPLVELGAVGAIPPGISVVEGGRIPYHPQALIRRAENRLLALQRDPEVKCYLPGIPRATYLPYPFQIVQSQNQMLMVYQYSYARREILLGTPEESPGDFWMGWSQGKWDGDTLVVDVTGFVRPTNLRSMDPTSPAASDFNWLDRSGNFYSENAHMVERFTPMGPNHLMYEVTIEDPTVYTRPWKITMPLYRRLDTNARILEFKCAELTEELRWGRFRKRGSRTQ